MFVASHVNLPSHINCEKTTAKRPEMAVKAGVVYAVMVEMYAVLGLLVTMFMVLMGGIFPSAG